MTDWDDNSFKSIVEFLSNREYLYNRNHKDNDTYTVIRECAQFGTSLKSPKSVREVLDKITDMRKNVTIAKQIIEKDCNEYNINDLEKFEQNVTACLFMYNALFGGSPEYIKLKLNQFFDKKLKRKSHETEELNKRQKMQKIQNTSNEHTLNDLQTDVCSFQENYENEQIFNNNENHDITKENSVKKDIVVDSLLKKRYEVIVDDESNVSLENLTNVNEIASEDEVITLKIINFIRDKPYFYNKHLDLYKNEKLKEDELSKFGKTFKPQMTGNHVQRIVNYILNQFYSSIKKPENERWCWYKHCEFLSNDISSSLKRQLVKPIINFVEIGKKNAKLLNDVVTFIEDNGCFYEKDDKDFYNVDLKKHMIKKFKKSLRFSYNENDIMEIITMVLRMISKIKKTKVVEKYSTKMPSFQYKINEKEFSVNTDIIYLDQLGNSCDEDYIQISNSNAIFENNLDEKKIKDSSFKSETDFNDDAFLFGLDNKNNIESRNDDWSDLSSDDGLTEIPFPEIRPQIKKILPNGKIQCEDCEELFDNGVKLHAHKKSHGEKSLLCFKCGKINKYYRKLRTHENNCNPEGNKFCYECKVNFKSHLNYYDHLNQYHSKSNPYVCACRQAFTSYNKIITHLNRSDCGSIDSCVLPEYVTKDFIKSFLEQRYDDEVEFVKNAVRTKFWCKICSRNYIRNDVYMKHFCREFHLKSEEKWLKVVGMDKIFPCDYCNRDDEPTIFKNLYDLVNHRHALHHKCTLTEFFNEMEYIATHSVIELEAELSLIILCCRICNDKYEIQSFREHFKMEEHKKCEITWIINYNLNKFTCKECSLDFSNLIEYFEHRHTTHLEWPTNKIIKSLEGKTFEMCGKNYYKYYCSVCDYKTNNKRSYARHIFLHGSHYKCSCGQIFKENKLSNHRLTKNCSVDGCIEYTYKRILKSIR